MKLRALPLILLAALRPVTTAAAPAGLPYVDEFDKPHDWVSESATWIGKIKDGRYIAENLTPTAGYLNWVARELPLAKDQDFEILTRVKMVDGTPNGCASIIWDAGADFRRIFEISTNGNYGVYGFEKGAWYYNHTNVPSKLIKKTEDNDLAIRGIGGRVYFFINGAVVDMIDYPGPAGPWIGLVTPAGCTNSFDRFEVRYLDGAPEKHATDARKYEAEARASLIASGPPLEDMVETFDDNHNQWQNIGEGDGWSSRIANGVLEWTNKKTGDAKQRTVMSLKINGAADYELLCRARRVAGSDNTLFGVAWNWSYDRKFTHEFGIAANGNYIFGTSVNGVYDEALPWNATSLVRKDDFNELRARKLGNTFFLFINGQVVADTPAKLISGEYLCIVVSQATTIAFDEMRVTYLKQTEEQTAAEKEKLVAALKGGHGKPGLGIVYSVAKQQEIASAQSKKDMQQLEDQRWKLTDADDKQMNKVRKQFDGKKLISLYGSWGRPAKITQNGAAVYYNYKLVGRTQYYYWFQIYKYGKQDEWLIQNISFSDNPL